jgi:hypothetical protein
MRKKVMLMNVVGVGLFFFLAFQLVWVKGGVLTTHPLPSITSFTPTSGLPGEIIKVIGTNFKAVTNSKSYRFKVNGVSAEVIQDSAKNQLQLRIPIGASSGRISIEKNSGVIVASSKADFEVVPGSLHTRQKRESTRE